MAGFNNNPEFPMRQPNDGHHDGGDKDSHPHDAIGESLVLAAYNPADIKHASAKMAERYALARAEERSYCSDAEKQAEVGPLAGAPPRTAIALGLESNALVHALSHDPTPEGLGKEGCMAAISHYVLEPYTRAHGLAMPHFVDSHAFLDYVHKHPELADVHSVSQKNLQLSDLQPGDIVVGNKGGDNHVMIATRVPVSWGYPEGSIMLCGNTGLPMPDGPPYPHFRAAQEVIGPGTDRYNYHHGQLNSQQATNPYLGGSFQIVRMKDTHS